MDDSYKISETLFQSKSHVQVLSVLADVDTVMSVSQIARRSGLTRRAVETVLNRLEKADIVLVTRSGNARVFQLNRDNVFARNVVLPLFDLEIGLQKLMAEDIKKALGPLASSIIMFGSFARQDHSSTSDVDIVVVTNEERGLRNLDGVVEQTLTEYSSAFRKKFGHSLEALIYDQEQAAQLKDRAPALFEEIRQDGFLIAGSVDWIDHE